MSIDTFIYSWEPLLQSIFPESCLVLLPSHSPPTEATLFWYFHLGLVLHVLKLDINDINSVFCCVQVLFLNIMPVISILLHISTVHSFVLLSILLYSYATIGLSLFFLIFGLFPVWRYYEKSCFQYLYIGLCVEKILLGKQLSLNFYRWEYRYSKGLNDFSRSHDQWFGWLLCLYTLFPLYHTFPHFLEVMITDEVIWEFRWRRSLSAGDIKMGFMKMTFELALKNW